MPDQDAVEATMSLEDRQFIWCLARVDWEISRQGESHIPPFDDVETLPNGGDARFGYLQKAERYVSALPRIRKAVQDEVFAEFEKRFVDGDFPERLESTVRAAERKAVLAEVRERLKKLERHSPYEENGPVMDVDRKGNWLDRLEVLAAFPEEGEG